MRARIARSFLAVVAAVSVDACGGSSPAAPNSPGVASSPVLTPGAYTLVVTMGLADDPPVGTSGAWISVVCVPAMNTPVPAVPVYLERAGDLVVIRAEPLSATLRMELRPVGGILEGWATGEMGEGSVRLWIGSPDGTFKARATAWLDRGVVSGRIDGQVSINGGACTNNAHTWALRPR